MVNFLANILWGIISGGIGFASAYCMSNINARRVAAERLHAAFAPELAVMRRTRADKSIDREQLQTDAFSRHAFVIEEFRPFVRRNSAREVKTGTSCLARVSLAPSVTTTGIALLDVPHLADGRYQHAFAFEPRQQRADALMDAAAEAKTADRTPRDVVFVLPRPSARIAVGATEKHQHLFAFAEFDPVDLDRTNCRAEEGLHRGLTAHGLLERGATRPGSVRSFANCWGKCASQTDGTRSLSPNGGVISALRVGFLRADTGTMRQPTGAQPGDMIIRAALRP